MNKIKKINILNILTFSIFVLVFFVYLSITIISKNTYSLFLTILPFLFMIGTLLRIPIKKGKIPPEIIGAIASIADVSNSIVNGFSFNSFSIASNLNSEDFSKEAIKKYYPAIPPHLSFAALLFVPFLNFLLYLIMDGLIDIYLYYNSIINASIISAVLYFIGIFPSMYALKYEYGEKIFYKNLKTFLIILIALMIIIGISIIISY